MKSTMLTILIIFIANWGYSQNEITLLASAERPSFSEQYNSNQDLSTPKLKETKGEKAQFFIDGMLGLGSYSTGHAAGRNPTAISLGFRLGHKWYLGGTGKWKFGVQGTWARIGVTFGFPRVTNNGTENTIALHLAPSAGFINLIQFNDKYALEANLNIGFNLMISFIGAASGGATATSTLTQPGMIINPAAKFRMGDLALGVDIAYLYGGPGPWTYSDSNGNTGSGTYNGISSMVIASVTIGKVF